MGKSLTEQNVLKKVNTEATTYCCIVKVLQVDSSKED